VGGETLKWLAAEFMVQNSLFFNAFIAALIPFSHSIVSRLPGRSIVVNMVGGLECYDFD